MDDFIPENLYRTIVSGLPICTVDVALFDRDAGRALVFRRSHPPLQGLWFTLGGRLYKNESLLECALRQAKVEAGLTLAADRLIFGGAFEEVHEDSRFGQGITYHSVNICWGYLLTEDAEIRLDRQHDEYAWKPVGSGEFHRLLSRKLTDVQRVMRNPPRRVCLNCS
jgi:colanic acid biosynthesis protein WcaH